MKKLICILLLVTMTISIFADNSSPIIIKKVSGVNKNILNSDRDMIRATDINPSMQKISIKGSVQKDNINYNQQESNAALKKDISKSKTKPNYLVWGLGILTVVVAGLALSSHH